MQPREILSYFHKEGHVFIIISLIFAAICVALVPGLWWFGVVTAVWTMYFFRNPVRHTPILPNIVTAPADGRIVAVVADNLPAEIAEKSNKVKYNRVSIFLNVFDVHVNRLPLDCTVSKLSYHPGKFLNASFDKASKENERQSILISPKNDKEKIGVVQIAGLIAKRIVCDLEEKQEGSAGEVFGIIRFGSRVDLFLPVSYDIQVTIGQTMIGGETIIASKGKESYKNVKFTSQ